MHVKFLEGAVGDVPSVRVQAGTRSWGQSPAPETKQNNEEISKRTHEK